MRNMKKASDGFHYYADSYLWTPKKSKPSTWKFRYKTFKDGKYKVEWRQLSRAALAFAPEADKTVFEGIPQADQYKLKSRIACLYRSVGVKAEDIPFYLNQIENEDGEKLMKERMTIFFDELNMTEGMEGLEAEKRWDKESGVINNLAFISPWSKNKRRYHDPVIESAVSRGVYEGAPCFLDHKDENGRSVRDLIGTWKETRFDKETRRGRAKLHTMRQHRDLIFDIIENAPTQAAPSHVVQAVSKRAKDENGKAFEDITHIQKCFSVDIVVGAATIDNITEGLTMPEWKDITIEDIMTARPELLDKFLKENAPSDEGGDEVNYRGLYETEKKKREDAEAERKKVEEEREAEKKSVESKANLEKALADSPLNDESKDSMRERLNDVDLTEEQAKKVVDDQIKLIEMATGKKLKKESKVRIPKDEDGDNSKSDRDKLTEAMCRNSGIEVPKKEKKGEE